MENNEQTRPPKKYCCSNTTQTEGSLFAKFDLLFEGLYLVSLIVSVILVVNTDYQYKYFGENSQGANNQSTTDIYSFRQWSPGEAQITVLSMSIVGSIIRIVFTIVLLIGVKKKKHPFLLSWFIYTIISVIILIISGLTLIFTTSDKVFLSILFIFCFLYKWYCLWIIKLLLNEIRSVGEGYANANPMDEGGEIDHANNLVPNSQSFSVDKF